MGKRFKKFITEDVDDVLTDMNVGGYPDKYYGTPGAAVWIYWAPYFFWGDSKKQRLMSYKEILIDYSGWGHATRDRLKQGHWTHLDVNFQVANWYSGYYEQQYGPVFRPKKKMKIPKDIYNADKANGARGRSYCGYHEVYWLEEDGSEWTRGVSSQQKFHVKKAIDICYKLNL
jgi:hypothetical protein